MAGVGGAHLRGNGAIVSVENLVVEFPAGKGQKVHAVSDVSFDILEGETLGLVGESGCGKSTTGRALLQLPPPTSGSVTFDGRSLTGMREKELRALRPLLQMILQDPISSLNDRRKVKDLVAEGLRIGGVGRAGVQARVAEVLSDVGLDPTVVADRRPRSFSGGQCQRICIARALVLDPKLIVCDEPVSALDVSVQAQILNLLEDMKARYGLTLLFITHDLGVVRNVSDRIIVMYLGRICEVATTEELFERPSHPYTQVLLASVPRPDPTARRARLSRAVHTELPSPINPPSGCRFHTRCPLADDRCRTETPEVRAIGPDHFVACHHAEQAAGTCVGISDPTATVPAGHSAS